MGFGMLLLGYFTATVMSLNSFGAMFALVGYVLSAVAAKKLAQYNTSFYFLLIAAIPQILLSGIIAYGALSGFAYEKLLLDVPVFSESLTATISNIKLAFDFIFTAALCFSVRRIATETGAEKVPYLAVRNFVFYCLAAVLQILYTVCLSGKWQVMYDFAISTMLPAWAIIITLVTLLLNCLMLLSCYRQICDVDDVDMPQKPSRFEFVNRRRAEKEARRQAYIEEAEQYRAARQSEQSNTRRKKRG